MNQAMRSLIYSCLFLMSHSYGAEVYKENFVGGVYIYDGDEPYVSALEIPVTVPRERVDSKNENTDLIINNLASGLYDKWTKTKARALTYCVSSKFGASKTRILAALDEATSDWMGAGNVKYVYMPQHDSKCDQKNTSVVFDVRPVSGQPYLARAFFPNSPRASRNILVDASSLKYNDVALTGFLRHELGHTLGFRHEHISKSANGSCPEDGAFSPLTSYDPFSVMHYPQCGGKNIITNMILSQLDEEGMRDVYPF